MCVCVCVCERERESVMKCLSLKMIPNTRFSIANNKIKVNRGTRRILFGFAEHRRYPSALARVELSGFHPKLSLWPIEHGHISKSWLTTLVNPDTRSIISCYTWLTGGDVEVFNSSFILLLAFFKKLSICNIMAEGFRFIYLAFGFS